MFAQTHIHHFPNITGQHLTLQQSFTLKDSKHAEQLFNTSVV